MSPEPAASPLARLVRLPARLLLGLIWLYQRSVSPAIPVLFGPTCGCRFHPTCSHYAAEAVRLHGATVGSWYAIRRLLRCQPLHPGGFDPVPGSPDVEPAATASPGAARAALRRPVPLCQRA